LIDLGVRSRVAFAVLWIGGQAALCISAAWRPDGAFGFRMFPEASSITIHVEGVTPREWMERVKDPILENLDVPVNAAYGANAQLQRLQAAIDDAAREHHKDVTARVMVSVNGREPHEVILRSRK
jgi:hypothetical protein